MDLSFYFVHFSVSQSFSLVAKHRWIDGISLFLLNVVSDTANSLPIPLLENQAEQNLNQNQSLGSLVCAAVIQFNFPLRFSFIFSQMNQKEVKRYAHRFGFMRIACTQGFLTTVPFDARDGAQVFPALGEISGRTVAA